MSEMTMFLALTRIQDKKVWDSGHSWNTVQYSNGLTNHATKNGHMSISNVFKYYSSRISDHYLTYYSTPSNGQILNIFWISRPGWVIHLSLVSSNLVSSIRILTVVNVFNIKIKKNSYLTAFFPTWVRKNFKKGSGR